MTSLSDKLTAADIARIVHGRLKGEPGAVVLRGRADSRLCRDGDLYVALPGERTDGSLFIEKAWEAGASVVLADSAKHCPAPPEGKALIAVTQPLSALQALARSRRHEAGGLRVAGITGSNGKTTTKEILGAILRAWKGENVLVTEGNYNSDVGLPLTLLNLRSNHELAVLEMGMNRIGEMSELASIAVPDVAVITNVGTAHIGMIGSQEAVAAEKRSIFDYAAADTTAVVDGSGSWRDFLLEGFPGQIRYFGEWPGAGWESFENKGIDGFSLVRCGQTIRFALPGMHNLMNAMAAVEAASVLGAPESAIRNGLEQVQPPPGRSEIVRGAVTIIRDCYNANPESMEASLQLLQGTRIPGRKIVVMGDLKELGDSRDAALRKVGGATAAANPSVFFLFGEDLSAAADSAVEAGYGGEISSFSDIGELGEALRLAVKSGDLVLLKGSRGSALERLDDVLAEISTG